MTNPSLTSRIQLVIEHTLKVPATVWRNRSNKKTNTLPRYILSHFQRMAGMSFGDIAKGQGLRSYTSIYFQLQTLQDWMETNETIRNHVATIHTQLLHEKIQLQAYPVPVLLRGRNSSAALSHLRGQFTRNSNISKRNP